MKKLTKEYLNSIIDSDKTHYIVDDLITICVLVVKPGFKIIGTSACLKPENYNKEIGEQYAFENAFEQLWEFEGYHQKRKEEDGK